MPFVDELDFAVGWLEPEPAFMTRTAHAVRAADGRVWVIDPFDAKDVDAEARVRALGPVAGVVRLLDRHGRDCDAWAQRLGVPLLDVPRDGLGSVEVVPVLRAPGWKEVALWFADTRTLVVADALAAAPGYRAAGEPLGVHPFLRLRPPRSLGARDVEHLLLGHGAGLRGDAARTAVAEALRTSRARAPRFVLDSARRVLGR